MKVSGINYCCNEQRYQKAKADEFEDDKAAAKIMVTSNPTKMYVIGQNIKNNFDEARWRRVCDNIMLEGLLVKGKCGTN